MKVRRVVGRSFDWLHFRAGFEVWVTPKNFGRVCGVRCAGHFFATFLADYFVHVRITLIAARITDALKRACSPPASMLASYIIASSSRRIE